MISEETSKVIVFPNQLFEVVENETSVSVAYLVLCHILAEKLRHSTALSLLRKNVRSQISETPTVAIIDPNYKSRKKIKMHR